MTWFKVDDGFAVHPKAVAAGNAAIGLWVRAGAWCAQQLTDGLVPRHMLGVLGAKPKDAAALVAVGLWGVTDDGWCFHDWETYQPSREKVEAERHAATERQRRAREAAMSRRDKTVTHAEVQPQSRSPRPDPTRPEVPNGTSALASLALGPPAADATSSTDRPRPAPAAVPNPKLAADLAGFDEFWAAYPRRSGKDDARKAWVSKGCRLISALVTAGAARYRDDPNREDAFTKHPATWLRAGCWEDDPLPPRAAPITRGQAEQDRVDRIFAEGLAWARDADAAEASAVENGGHLRAIGGSW